MMGIRTIRTASAASLRTRVAAFVAVPALAAVVLLTAPAPAAHAATGCTPDAIAKDIGVITHEAARRNTALRSLNTSSAPQKVATQEENVVSGLQAMIDDFTRDVTAWQACPPLVDDVAQPVVTASSDLTTATSSLLSTLISKHTIFAQFARTAPIAAVLRSFEASVDSYAFELLNKVPSRQTDIQRDKDTLDTAVGDAITTYDQICVPSPLYPTVPPVCAAP